MYVKKFTKCLFNILAAKESFSIFHTRRSLLWSQTLGHGSQAQEQTMQWKSGATRRGSRGRWYRSWAATKGKRGFSDGKFLWGWMEVADEIAKVGLGPNQEGPLVSKVKNLQEARTHQVDSGASSARPGPTGNHTEHRHNSSHCIAITLHFIFVVIVLTHVEVSRPFDQWWAVICTQTEWCKKTDHWEKGLCLSTNTLTTYSDGKGDTGKMPRRIGQQSGRQCFPYLSQLCSFPGRVSIACDRLYSVRMTPVQRCLRWYFQLVFMCYHI